MLQSWDQTADTRAPHLDPRRLNFVLGNFTLNLTSPCLSKQPAQSLLSLLHAKHYVLFTTAIQHTWPWAWHIAGSQ